MKRFLLLLFFAFWSLGIFFLVRFFTALRSTYRSKANLAQNTVLKIIPIIQYDPALWDENQINLALDRYHGLIIQADNLSEVRMFSQKLHSKNPQFPLYLQVAPTQINSRLSLFADSDATKPWFLEGDNVDIRDPQYRQAFFNFWSRQIADLGLNGLLLTGLTLCPGKVSDLVCQNQYGWWKMAVLDFMSQIRQYFSSKTILFSAAFLSDNQVDFTRQLLPQTDGMTLTDFNSIYHDDNSFGRYYQLLTGILQDPQYQQKQLLFQVTADPTQQAFFLASYLLFANQHSSFYFASTPTGLPKFDAQWQQEYQPSLDFAVRLNNGLYQRRLGNALILVNPGLTTQTQVLNQNWLKGQTLRLWNQQPLQYADSVSVLGKSSQIINLLSQPTVSPSQNVSQPGDWSDLNTSRYSDFDNLFIRHNPDALILGNKISLESEPKPYDDYDDGLLINGLEAGIFNLARLRNYRLQIHLRNRQSNDAQVWVWVDWDGKGNRPPELVFNQTDFSQNQLEFDLTIPEYAHDYVFIRVIAKDQDQGEVEDYLLNILAD